MHPRMPAWRALGAALGLAGGLSACGFEAEHERPSEATPPESPPVTVTRQVDTPPCENPAPLNLVPDELRIPDQYLVVFREDGVEDPDALTTLLEQRYGFTAKARFHSMMRGFSAVLPPASVAAIRCEPGVDLVEENIRVWVG